MKRLLRIGALASALALPLASLGGCATVPAQAYPEAASFDPSLDAGALVENAMARARADGKKVLLVMGANWCHDSRALAGWLGTPRFRQLVSEKYELAFVDVGTPQTGNGRNLDIARRFGIEVKATPTVLILSSTGELLNADTAESWNNASTRSEAEIYDELAGAAG